MELNDASRENTTLRKRSLLYLSDGLLTLGQWSRPVEFRVQIQEGQAQELAEVKKLPELIESLS